MQCQVCEFENPPGMRYCGQCGSPLQPVLAAPEERRPVTVLFADVVGSTELSARDDERFREQMARFYAIAREEVQRFGGVVEKFIGDAVMTVFGLPVIHEDDPLRAVRAALAIRDRLAPDVRDGILPEIRIGVNTGDVVADPKAAARGEFLVTGEPVSLGARLQQHARPGQVLVSSTTHAATEGAIKYQALPPISVKGVAGPVTIYEAISVAGGRAVPRQMRAIGSPVVGREGELAVLRSAFERLASGSGGILSIIGEAGFGKSRLLAELRPAGSDRNMLWLEGQTLSLGQTLSYWPFRQIIQSAAGITPADSEPQAWIKLEDHVEDLVGDETADVLPYLATLLALQVRMPYEKRVQYLDAEAMRRQLFRASRRYVEGLARRQPVALIVEDLHWIDESSAALLEHLLPLTSAAPVLAVVLARPEQDTPAAGLREIARHDYAGKYVEVTLAALSADGATRLMSNLLAVDQPPARVRDLVLRTAEGNPFFIEQVVRALIDAKAIVRDNGAGPWKVTAELDRVSIPDTLRGVILTRIDQLDEGLKQVLKAAAVIGRTFLHTILSTITGLGERLDDYIRELIQLELIWETHRLPERTYSFKHVLTQEAAYESMLFRHRREMHRHVGEAIEAHFSDRLDEFSPLLADHYARAEAWDQAQRYLLQAGDQAGRMAADAEALSHYQQALAAYTRMFGDNWDPLQRAQLERKMGEALYRRGEHDQAMARLEKALSILGQPRPADRAVRGRILKESVRHVGRRIFHRHTSVLRGPVDPVADELVRTYLTVGWIDFWTNPERLLLDMLLGLDISERAGHPTGIASGFAGLGVLFDELGIFRIAARYHNGALALIAHAQNPSVLGLVSVGAGFHAALTGRLDSAEDLYLQAAEAYRDAGDLKGWALARLSHVSLLFVKGQIASGLAQTEEVLRMCQDTGDRQIISWGLALLGRGSLARGDLDTAASHLAHAAEQFSHTPDSRWSVNTLASQASCAVRKGNVGEALARVEEAEQTIAHHRIIGYPVMLLSLARAEATLAALEEAPIGERSRWLHRAQRACHTALRFRRFSEAEPPAYRLQGTLEWLQGSSRARSWWERSLKSADRLGFRYELAVTHLVMGRRLSDPGHVARAEALFSEMGARV